jgi:hypothetical protein
MVSSVNAWEVNPQSPTSQHYHANFLLKRLSDRHDGCWRAGRYRPQMPISLGFAADGPALASVGKPDGNKFFVR